MAGIKTLTNPFKELTFESKKNIYLTCFSSGAMTTESFEDKLELYHLLCYLSFKLKQSNPLQFSNTLKVLEKMLGREIDTSVDANGYDNFLVGLSITCDDFLYGANDVKKPEKYKDIDKVGKIIEERIKQLLEQWIAF